LTKSAEGLAVKKLLYESRFVFTPNGHIVLHFQSKIFSGKIVTEEDLVVFGTGVISGTWPEVKFSENVDSIISRIKSVDSVKVDIESAARARIDAKEGIVICRVELVDNVPVRTLLFDVSTKSLAVLPSSVSVAEYVRPGSMVVDPKIYNYVDNLNCCWGPGGWLIPSFNGCYGYAAFGYSKDGGAFSQMKNEIARLFGIGIRCDISQLNFGLYFWDESWNTPVSRYILPIHRGVYFSGGIPRCVLCERPLPKRATIKVPGHIHVANDQLFVDPMCNLCAQLPLCVQKGDFKTFFHQLGLDALSSPGCVSVSIASTDWECDVSPLLIYLDPGQHGPAFHPNQILGESLVGRSKALAIRAFHKKAVSILMAGGERVQQMLTPVQYNQFKFGYCVGVLLGGKLINSFGAYQRLYISSPFFVRVYLDSVYKCDGVGFSTQPKDWVSICLRYLYGEEFNNLNTILGTGFHFTSDDMELINSRDDRLEVDLLMGGFG